ncbi:MAG: hypothetical protein R3A46_03895 [Thermomicrobiales bacterium]
MAGGYQPLATYGAVADIPIEEARFHPGVNDVELIQTGKLGARYLRSADGFQSLVYFHDGERHRVLAFWQDHGAIQRFHMERRAELVELESKESPESPWLTRLEGFRSGIALRQLMGPRMNLEQTDLEVPSPPAVAIVHDAVGLTDVVSVFNIWCELVPTGELAKIQQFRGFMFFSACDFGNGDLTVYLAFRTEEDLVAFQDSDFNAGIQQRVTDAIDAQYASSTFRHGRLLAWTVRQLD